MNAPKNPAEAPQVTIRPVEPGDTSGIRSLLAQMPHWESARQGPFRDEGIVAVDNRGHIVGWLAGNHSSFAWLNTSGYDMPEDWCCSFIEWLLVDSTCRSAGIGSSLMEAFALDSSAAGRDTIIASPQSGEDERALLAFYYRLGYRRTESGHVHRGPWGPHEDVPLPAPGIRTPAPALSAKAQAIICHYKEALG